MLEVLNQLRKDRITMETNEKKAFLEELQKTRRFM